MSHQTRLKQIVSTLHFIACKLFFVMSTSTFRKCSCGCNRLVSRTTEWRHNDTPLRPSPKRRRIAQTRVSQEPSSSDHPQLHSPSFEPNFPLPLLDPPPASNLLQSTGDAHTGSSVLIVDDILRKLYVRTHRTTDQSDDEDSEDALEGGADSVDHETDDFWNGEDISMEGDLDPREGIVSDWDLLAEEFIVEAEELGEFEPSLLHTP